MGADNGGSCFSFVFVRYNTTVWIWMGFDGLVFRALEMVHFWYVSRVMHCIAIVFLVFLVLALGEGHGNGLLLLIQKWVAGTGSGLCILRLRDQES